MIVQCTEIKYLNVTHFKQKNRQITAGIFIVDCRKEEYFVAGVVRKREVHIVVDIGHKPEVHTAVGYNQE